MTKVGEFLVVHSSWELHSRRKEFQGKKNSARKATYLAIHSTHTLTHPGKNNIRAGVCWARVFKML